MAYKQAQNRKKHLKRTFNETKNSYGSGVWYNEERGFFYKYTASNTPGYAKSLRKIGNKKVRKVTNLGNFSDYRRHYDYKWALY
jgi:hypothetical protein